LSVLRSVFAAVALMVVPALGAEVARTTYADAAAVLESLAEHLPADFRGRTPAEIAVAWPAWVARRDAEIRQRLARGDEDSVVNLWMYGTSFTTEPRATTGDESVLRARLDDLVDAVMGPRQDERLQLARQVVERRMLDPRSRPHRDDIRRYLMDLRKRMIDEFARSDRALAPVKLLNDAAAEAAASATIFRERGLSTDTSFLSDFAIASALEAIKVRGQLATGSVRRVAVVGPGLDFTNKADGYDFYPPQTIQPFALADTLTRLGLAAPGLTITTFDVNGRVNAHLREAIARAAAGRAYPMTVPLDEEEGWMPPVERFWTQLGQAIGHQDDVPRDAPPAAGRVRTRTIRVRAGVVRSVEPRELNIVVDRLSPVDPSGRFDLIVATNVLVYYDLFEQALAAGNAASMLRSGGLFLTNTAVLPTPPLRPTAEYLRVVYSARQHDHVFWYQRE
jgi:hypothetical protein